MSKQQENVGSICLKWWKELNPTALARLRRAATPVIALQEFEAIRLAKKLSCTLENSEKLARIGAIASVLAHVKPNDNSQSIARELGPQKKDEPGVMSTLRFRNLLAATDSDDLMREMRRAVKFLKGNVNVCELANAMFYWGDQERIKWTYNYWQKGFAAPEDHAPETSEKNEQSPNQELTS